MINILTDNLQDNFEMQKEKKDLWKAFGIISDLRILLSLSPVHCSMLIVIYYFNIMVL